jgi:hypothetical protein
VSYTDQLPWSLKMKEISLLLGTLLLWIALNRWVLPWFGIQTCMSGACATSCCPSCGTESCTNSDQDALEPKGNQK